MLSCLTNSYGRFGPEAALAHLPEIGLGFLELPIRNAGTPSFFRETPWLTDAATEADTDGVLRRLEAAQLQLSSCNITSGNPRDPEVLERTLRKIRIAGKLGVNLVVAGAGELNSPEEWPQLVEHLRQIGDAAAEHGIVYCCETHPGVCQNAAGMLETMQRVAHPHVRVNFDTGNLFYYNPQPDLLAELESVLPFVRHLHLKDTTGLYQDWHFPALGDGGAVDFCAVHALLKRSSFSGPCSLELEGIRGEPDLSLETCRERIERSVAHLRSLGDWTFPGRAASQMRK